MYIISINNQYIIMVIKNKIVEIILGLNGSKHAIFIVG